MYYIPKPITAEYKYTWEVIYPDGANLKYHSLETVSFVPHPTGGLCFTFHPAKNLVFVDEKKWYSTCCDINIFQLTESLYPVELHVSKDGETTILQNYDLMQKRWQETCDRILAQGCCDSIKAYIEYKSKSDHDWFIELLLHKDFIQFFSVSSSGPKVFRFHNFPDKKYYPTHARFDLVTKQNNISIYNAYHPRCKDKEDCCPSEGEFSYCRLENGIPSWASCSYSIDTNVEGVFTKKLDIELIGSPLITKDNPELN